MAHYGPGNPHGKSVDSKGAVRNETGNNVVVRVRGNEIPVTSASWDIEQEIASSDFNDNGRKYTGAVARSATGTIEIDGDNTDLREAILNSDGIAQNHIEIRIQTLQDVIVFEEVLFENFSGEVPGAGKTTRTVDWHADDFRFD